MKKRVKPSWKSLTKGEKTGVIIFYAIGICIIAKFIEFMYLNCIFFW